jgi:isopentenyldiphosphate isomerase
LNSIASFAADGGLGESASWVSLRQHIYISLTSQDPFTINLTNYRDSKVFHNSDDESWANRIIYIFANILTQVFRPGHEQISTMTWAELNAEVANWDRTKPWHFSPLFVQDPQRESANEPTRSPWPELYMCNPAQGKQSTATIGAGRSFDDISF